jgi:hypothetical protein
MLISTQLNFFNFMRKTGISVAAFLFVLAASGLAAYGQMPEKSPTPVAVKQVMGEPKTDDPAEEEEDEIVHPFFTHMGIPEGVGAYNLRILGVLNRVDGANKGDFGFHLETGLTKRIGLHVRNDSFLNRTRSEFMFQFLAIKSRDGMSGFSPIIEFEVPTRRGGGSRVNTLVGFTTALVNKRAAFNQVIHYNPREDSVDYSFALVVRAGKKYFPVFEVLGEGAKGERPIVDLLGGLKVRVSKNFILGFAFRAPITSRKDFSWQSVYSTDIEWKVKY